MKIYLAADSRGHKIKFQPMHVLFSYFDLGIRNPSMTKNQFKLLIKENQNENQQT